MLLQRRDWLFNTSVYLSVWAAAMCPLAIEMMQRFFAYAMQLQDVDPDRKDNNVYDLVILNRAKNMMIKVILMKNPSYMLECLRLS